MGSVLGSVNSTILRVGKAHQQFITEFLIIQKWRERINYFDGNVIKLMLEEMLCPKTPEEVVKGLPVIKQHIATVKHSITFSATSGMDVNVTIVCIGHTMSPCMRIKSLTSLKLGILVGPLDAVEWPCYWTAVFLWTKHILRALIGARCPRTVSRCSQCNVTQHIPLCVQLSGTWSSNLKTLSLVFLYFEFFNRREQLRP